MRIAQTSEEQSRKSQGRGAANIMRASGTLHADDRIHHGFPFRSVLAEFRALRATVLRLYAESGASDRGGGLRRLVASALSATAMQDRVSSNWVIRRPRTAAFVGTR